MILGSILLLFFIFHFSLQASVRRELISVIIPSKIIIIAPARAIYVRSKGALLKSQPVTPPISNIGEIAVPIPNKTAKATLSMGLANRTEESKRAIKGGQRTRPLLKPKVKAPTSNLFVSHFGLRGGWLQLQEEGFLFLDSRLTPIIIVTMLKTIVE
jgi:hypothetical protein